MSLGLSETKYDKRSHTDDVVGDVLGGGGLVVSNDESPCGRLA